MNSTASTQAQQSVKAALVRTLDGVLSPKTQQTVQASLVRTLDGIVSRQTASETALMARREGILAPGTGAASQHGGAVAQWGGAASQQGGAVAQQGGAASQQGGAASGTVREAVVARWQHEVAGRSSNLQHLQAQLDAELAKLHIEKAAALRQSKPSRHRRRCRSNRQLRFQQCRAVTRWYMAMQAALADARITVKGAMAGVRSASPSAVARLKRRGTTPVMAKIIIKSVEARLKTASGTSVDGQYPRKLHASRLSIEHLAPVSLGEQCEIWDAVGSREANPGAEWGGMQRSIKAGLVRTQMEGAVSEATQCSIKAGLVRTQMYSTVSEETQCSIKAGLVRKQMTGTVSECMQRSIIAGLVRSQQGSTSTVVCLWFVLRWRLLCSCACVKANLLEASAVPAASRSFTDVSLYDRSLWLLLCCQRMTREWTHAVVRRWKNSTCWAIGRYLLDAISSKSSEAASSTMPQRWLRNSSDCGSLTAKGSGRQDSSGWGCSAVSGLQAQQLDLSSSLNHQHRPTFTHSMEAVGSDLAEERAAELAPAGLQLQTRHLREGEVEHAALIGKVAALEASVSRLQAQLEHSSPKNSKLVTKLSADLDGSVDGAVLKLDKATEQQQEMPGSAVKHPSCNHAEKAGVNRQLETARKEVLHAAQQTAREEQAQSRTSSSGQRGCRSSSGQRGCSSSSGQRGCRSSILSWKLSWRCAEGLLQAEEQLRRSAVKWLLLVSVQSANAARAKGTVRAALERITRLQHLYEQQRQIATRLSETTAQLRHIRDL